MYRVLLPVDEQTERAMLAAEAAASFPTETEDVEITVLNVFEAFDVADEGGQVRSEDIWDETDFPDSVYEVVDYLESAGIRVTKRREHGDPADQIVSVAEEIDADSIVMSGRKRSPTGKALFGSVVQSVLVSADCPVMVNLSD
jgi:nucleotide-binding universal stress UspA family protein